MSTQGNKPTPRKRARTSVRVNQAQSEQRKVQRALKRRESAQSKAQAQQRREAAAAKAQARAQAKERRKEATRSLPAPSQQKRKNRSARPTRQGASYSSPALWTKEGSQYKQASKSGGPVIMAPKIQSSKGKGRSEMEPQRVKGPSFSKGTFKAVFGVIVALMLIVGVDTALNWGKAFPGVRVAGIELGGMTQEQAQEAISQVYSGRMYHGVITVYAGEEQKEAVEKGQENDLGPEEQLSVEQVQANTKKWEITPAELGATVDYAERAQTAISVGRSDLIIGRLRALLGGVDLDLGVSFDQEKVEAFAQKVDKTIGDPRLDWNIKVENGKASVTEGHDGYMVDRDQLSATILNILLTSENGSGEFIANAPYAPLRIDEEAATAVCETVNKAIADGALIACDAVSWQASASEVGAWIVTKIEQRNGSWKLIPFVDENASRANIVQQLGQAFNNKAITVSFTIGDSGPVVGIAGEGTMPQIPQAAQDLTVALFGDESNKPQEGASEADGTPVSIQVGVGPLPSSMGFQEALDSGIIQLISAYTTEYNTGEGTEARVNNIHVAADELNNSICPAQGSWSFNDVAGESTEEKGFQAAGSILDGEYVDSIGGGVCQVATTVFNAVYEAGFPVLQRRNHSLYIAAYPEGRDAAVSWPDLDLKWSNDTGSDVLMCTSYTDSSVTVSLYGISPGYTVTTQVGDWQPGKKFKKVTKKDPDYPVGYTEIQTTGTNGSVITVVRTVKDSQGNVIREDEFTSEYDPKDEVTLVGTGGTDGSGSGEDGSSGEGDE